MIFVRGDNQVRKGILALIVIASVVLSSATIVSAENIHGPQQIVIQIVNQNGNPIQGAAVQGMMISPPTNGSFMRTVSIGKTNSMGLASISNMTLAMSVSNEWASFDRSSGLNMGSSLLVFITYNDSGSIYFREASVSINSYQILHGNSAFERVTLNETQGDVLVQNNSVNGKPSSFYFRYDQNTGSINGGKFIPNVEQNLPSIIPAVGLSSYYWYQDNSSFIPQSGTMQIPLAWVTFQGSSYGDLTTIMQESELSDTGVSLNPYNSNQVEYQPGGQLFSTNSGGTTYTGSSGIDQLGDQQYSAGSSAYTYLNGQIELATYSLWYIDPSTDMAIPMNEYMAQSAIVNIATSGSNLQLGIATGEPPYYSTLVEYNNYNSYALPDSVGNGGGTMFDITTSSVYQGSINDGTWLDIAATAGSIIVGAVTGGTSYAVELGLSATVLSGIIGAITIGSSTYGSVYSEVGYNAPSGYTITGQIMESNVYYQIGSNSMQVPIFGLVINAFPTSSGGGGGGCVLNGTLVSTSNNKAEPVQTLGVGDRVLSYNPLDGSFFENRITSITVTEVHSILNIDNGFLYVSGLNDQPIYALLPNGTAEWLMVGNLTTSDHILDPLNGSWIPVSSIVTAHGNFTVYDLGGARTFYQSGHLRFTYLGNGVLLDKKITA